MGRGAAVPGRKTVFFSNIVFEFAELFLVAILVQNHKKIDKLTEIFIFNVNSKQIF